MDPPPPPPSQPPQSIETLSQPPQQPPSSSSQPPQQPPPSSIPPPPPSSSTTTTQIPNPNISISNSTISPLSQQQPNRPQQFARPWSQPSQYSHFPPQFQPGGAGVGAPSSSSAPLSSVSAPIPRGGIAIGVPAHHPAPPPPPAVSSQPTSFTPSFVSAQYGGIERNPVNVPGTVVPASNPATARPQMPGMPNMGMIGSQMRPGGLPTSALNPQRPVQAASGIRPQAATNNLPPVSQNYQGHGMLRASSVASPSSSTPSTSQSQQTLHQPWLSSAPHGRPPLPSQSFRPQVNSQPLQQRSHIPQQPPQSTPATPQPQLSSSPQQQQPFPTSNQSQENYGPSSRIPQSQENYGPLSRVPQPSVNQPQIARVQGIANQRLPSPATVQPNSGASPIDKMGGADTDESCSKILRKRNIQELVNQMDPSERLDPDVEDVLVDIAEDFIDSVTTFGCSLAKHRKSNTLEAKDILLHLERNWNMTLPGFGGDEIKTYKKPVSNDVHKERLAVIKKSLSASEMANTKSSAGAGAGNVKGHLAKATS